MRSIIRARFVGLLATAVLFAVGTTTALAETNPAGQVAAEADNGGTSEPVRVDTITTESALISEGESTEITITLNRPAPAGGFRVSPQSNRVVGKVGFRLTPSSIRIPQGQTQATFTLTAKDTATNEPTDTVVRLLAVRENLNAPKVLVTIEDDEDVEPPQPVIADLSSSQPNIPEDGGRVTVIATLSRPAGPQGFSATLRSTGTATRGRNGMEGDYFPTNGLALTIGANQTQGTVELDIRNDTAVEQDELIIISTPRDARFRRDAFVTIVDDDDGAPPLPAIEIVRSTLTDAIAEGTPARFSIVRGAQPVGGDLLVVPDITNPLTVRIAVTGAESFLAQAPPTSVTIAAGEASATLQIPTIDDQTDEADGVLKATIQPGDGYVIRNGQGSATVVITDNDEVPSPPPPPPPAPTAVSSVTTSPDIISEDGERSIVTVQLNQTASADGFSARVTLTGSARAGTDYDVPDEALTAVDATTFQLQFSPGSARQTFTVAAIADREKEGDETIVISVGDQSAGNTGSVKSATITLTDVFKESLLADVRRAGSTALLRRSTDRFSRLTGDIVSSRLSGGRFSRATENSEVRATLREFAGGWQQQVRRNKLGANQDVGSDRSSGQTNGGWDVWVSVNGAKLSGEAEGSVFDVYAGVDTIIAPGILIGVLASYEAGDLETSGTGVLAGEGAYTGGYDSRGYAVGAYAGLRLFRDLTLDLAGSYGRLSPEVSAVFRDGRGKAAGGKDARDTDRTITGEYRARRLLLASHLNGRVMLGNLLLSPQIGLVYARENQGGFIDSTNAEAPATTLEFARVEFGTKLAYDFDLNPEHGALGVMLTATGRSDFIRPEGVADQYSMAVRLGLEWVNAAGLSFKLEGGADGIGLDDYESYDASATVTVPF